MKFTKLLVFPFIALLVTSCASNPKQTGLRTAQVSHDTLAIAQDLEAQLCWGVSDALHAPADPAAAQHCTTQTAITIHLTDSLHQQINSKFKQAFELHKSLAALDKAGTTADYSNFNALLDSIVALIRQLQQTPQVAQLVNNVQGAKK